MQHIIVRLVNLNSTKTLYFQDKSNTFLYLLDMFLSLQVDHYSYHTFNNIIYKTELDMYCLLYILKGVNDSSYRKYCSNTENLLFFMNVIQLIIENLGNLSSINLQIVPELPEELIFFENY